MSFLYISCLFSLSICVSFLLLESLFFAVQKRKISITSTAVLLLQFFIYIYLRLKSEQNEFHLRNNILFLSVLCGSSLTYVLYTGRNLFRDFQCGHTSLLASVEKLRKTQQSLLKSEKFRIVGVMSAGIVHKIKIPLEKIKHMSLILSENAILEKLSPDINVSELNAIQEEIMKIAKIVSGLKSISHKTDNDTFVAQPLQKIFEDQVIQYSDYLNQKGIQFNYPAFPIKGTLLCKPPEIEHALANIIHNAADAAEQTPLPKVTIDFAINKTEFIFEVIDSGTAIAKDVQEKMMDPFFSTKREGQASGLGLPVSATLIEYHGGRLYYDSSFPNTRFVLALPLKLFSPS